MRVIQNSEAKTRLTPLLYEVIHGEIARNIRHGQPIARLVPETDRRQPEIIEAVANIRVLRRHIGKITVDEVASGYHESHAY